MTIENENDIIKLAKNINIIGIDNKRIAIDMKSSGYYSEYALYENMIKQYLKEQMDH